MSRAARLFLLLGAIFAFSGPPSHAQEMVSVTGFLPRNWEPDMPAGQTENQLRRLPCTVNSVNLRFRIEKANPDPNGHEMPQISISVRSFSSFFNPAPSDEGAVFLIETDPDTNLSALAFLKIAGGKSSDVTVFGVLAPHYDAVLSLTWTAAGVVTARVNGSLEASVTLSHAPASVMMAVSGTKAEFHEIQAGFSGADRPPSCPVASIPQTNAP